MAVNRHQEIEYKRAKTNRKSVENFQILICCRGWNRAEFIELLINQSDTTVQSNKKSVSFKADPSVFSYEY